MNRIVLVASLAFTAFIVRAEYLNWFIDPESSALSDYDFEGVRLGWYETASASAGATLDALAKADGIVGYSTELYPTFDGPAFISYDISALGADYSYFVEFVNYDTAVRHVAYSTAQTYAELNARGAISYTDMASMGSATSSLTTFANLAPVLNLASVGASVPEPTGALLVALGLAVLGLRRRV